MGFLDVSRAREPELYLRVLFFGIGFAPIGLLAMSLVGIAPLHRAAWLLVPVLTTALLVGLRYPVYAGLALKGLLVGVSATLFYDATRWPFVAMGFWPDFIPKIGAYLSNSAETNWVTGYLWRYLGNGGGMGLAFTMIAPWVASRIDVRKGAIVYGTIIWMCLLGTIFFCPDAKRFMFELTPMTFVMSLVGHLVYGGALGLLVYKFRRGRVFSA